MATFNNGESGSSVRTKINEAIDKVDGNAAFDNDIDVNGNLATADGATLGTTDALTGGTADGLNVVGASNGLLAKFGGNRAVYDRALQINEFVVGGTNNAGFQFNAEGTGGNAEMRFAIAGTDAVTISDDNYVGIGQTSPGAELHIRASTPQFRLQPTGDTQNNRIEFCNAAGVLQSRIMSGGVLGSTIQLDGDVEVVAGHNLTLPDNSELRFGNSDDLIIEHTGLNADMRNEVGHLYLRNLADNGDVLIQSDDGSGGAANYFRADGSTGEAQLFYYGSEKLNTTSSGVAISGLASIVSASPKLQFTDTSTGVDHVIDANSGVGNLVINTDINAEGSDPKLLLKVAGTTGITVRDTGNVNIAGALSKGSGSFKIDHPLKPESHHLVHSFVEAPQADNIYRGKVSLVAGAATVNLDEAGRMTEGTFVALNGNIQCFTSNEDGWTAVRGSVSGNTLTIEAQDVSCTDTVSWLVIGERHDPHMLDTDWTDAAGRVITEPEKQTEEEE